MPDNDLGLAMLELKIALEKVATAYLAEVGKIVRQEVATLAAAYPPHKPIVVNDPFGLLRRAEPCGIDMPHSAHDTCPGRITAARQFLLDRLEGLCPNRKPHSVHTWRFPDSDLDRRCPGVVWTHEQCTDHLAHHEHEWRADAVSSTGWMARWCHGLEEDLEVRSCISAGLLRPHDPHEWQPLGPEEDRPVFCKGVAMLSRCPYVGLPCGDLADPHPSHDYEGGHCHGRVRGHHGKRIVMADVEPCAADKPHALHLWTVTDGQPHRERWCRGKPCFPATVEVQRCTNGKAHDPHNWHDLGGDTLKACPGRRIWDTNLVPAGPDRHA